MSKITGDPVIKFFISTIGLVILFIVLKELQHIFIPFVIAYLLYFIFEPLNNFLTKKKVPLFGAVIIDLVIIVGLIWSISRGIIGSFSQFGKELPGYEQKLNHLVSSTAQSFGIADPAFTNFNLSEILMGLDYGGIASGFFSSTLSIFSTVVFVLFFFIFICSGHYKILEATKRRFSEDKIDETIENLKKEMKKAESSEVKSDYEKQIHKLEDQKEGAVEKTFKAITAKVQRYISTKFLISLLTGVLVGIALWIFGVDFVIVWAVLTFLLNFIPNIGSALAIIFPTLITLVQFESFGYTLIVAAVLMAIQNIIGNLLEPKIMGDQLGLNPLVILLSLLLWGYIWGIVGMFLSVPLTAMLQIIISNSKSQNLKFISELMGN